MVRPRPRDGHLANSPTGQLRRPGAHEDLGRDVGPLGRERGGVHGIDDVDLRMTRLWCTVLSMTHKQWFSDAIAKVQLPADPAASARQKMEKIRTQLADMAKAFNEVSDEMA